MSTQHNRIQRAGKVALINAVGDSVKKVKTLPSTKSGGPWPLDTGTLRNSFYHKELDK